MRPERRFLRVHDRPQDDERGGPVQRDVVHVASEVVHAPGATRSIPRGHRQGCRGFRVPVAVPVAAALGFVVVAAALGFVLAPAVAALLDELRRRSQQLREHGRRALRDAHAAGLPVEDQNPRGLVVLTLRIVALRAAIALVHHQKQRQSVDHRVRSRVNAGAEIESQVVALAPRGVRHADPRRPGPVHHVRQA